MTNDISKHCCSTGWLSTDDSQGSRVPWPKKFGSAESHGFCRKSVKNPLKTDLNRLILLVFIGFQQKRLVF
jgi:hypothetical protein